MGCGVVNAGNWYFFSSYLREVSLMSWERPLEVNNSSTRKINCVVTWLCSLRSNPMNHSRGRSSAVSVRQTEVLIMCIMIIIVLNTCFKTWYLPNWKKIRVFCRIGKKKNISAGLWALSGIITSNYSHWNNFRDEEWEFHFRHGEREADRCWLNNLLKITELRRSLFNSKTWPPHSRWWGPRKWMML